MEVDGKKKRIWITLLALILALGAFCIGASTEDGTFAARVTSNGVTQHYATVQEAFNAAKDGDTVGILGLGQGDRGTIEISQENLTVGIVGRGIDVTGLYFKVTGSVRFIGAGWDEGEQHYSASFYPLTTVENGGVLTVPEYYDSEKTAANAISFASALVSSGSSAVLGGGAYHILTAGGGTVNLSGSSVRVSLTLAVQNGGTLIAENVKLSCSFGVYSGTATLTDCTVESDGIIASGSTVSGGSCSTLDVEVYCWDNVTLRGGFGEIWVRAYEALEDQTVKKLDNIGYAQYAAMLDAGKGYRKSGGTFAGTADVTEDVYANPDYPYKVLQTSPSPTRPSRGCASPVTAA